jgi:hypothetical protein
MDFNIDQTGKHVVMLRGTLADNSRVQTVAQFPGQDPAAKNLDNSRGLAAQYTAVLSPSVINIFRYGYTRLGIAQSGTAGDSLTFDGLATFQNFNRAFNRIIPTHNIVNDTTWTKGTHTIQGGINFRLIQNDRNSYTNSFASYSFSRNTLQGLGSDISGAINNYIKQRSGNPNLPWPRHNRRNAPWATCWESSTATVRPTTSVATVRLFLSANHSTAASAPRNMSLSPGHLEGSS